MNAQGCVDLQAGFSPVADPVAVMQIGVAGIAVAHECLVVAAARAQRTSPAAMAVVLGVDMTFFKEILLFAAIKAGRDMSKGMIVGIGETMTRRQVARRPDAEQSEARAARVRLVHALQELADGFTDVREAMHLAIDGVFEPFVGERVELIDHAFHRVLAHGVLLIRRGRDRCKTNLVEPELMFQVMIDSFHIRHARGERDARGDGEFRGLRALS